MEDRANSPGSVAGAGITRRRFVQYGAGAGAGLLMWQLSGPQGWARARPVVCDLRAPLTAQDVLDPLSIPKYVTPLVIPPAMPRSQSLPGKPREGIDYYEIAVREFSQHILPASMGLEPTTVWSYGSVNHPETFNYPAFTIEAAWGRPARVKWINDLVDASGNYLPHLLPVDQTLHWANPPGGARHRDDHGHDQEPYRGPVPIVTHLHGGHSTEESDGYPEAWYLPHARNIPAGYARKGSLYRAFKAQAQAKLHQAWTPGSAVFQYDNGQRATTMWYHDHTLGMTRANVYAGPAGFYLLRGGPDDDGVVGTLPGPAPALGDPPGRDYFEIPIAIQDRSFNDDGSLFYPDSRAYFEGLDPSQLQIPFAPDPACGGPSDVAPIWHPEFFGNAIVVNGKTWPSLDVQRRRHRFRLLNGCNSRFLILRMDNDLPFWQIGNEGGFLPAPVELTEVLLGPAERADVIVDFTDVPIGTEITLLNIAPDEPFGGGVPGVDFEPANPETTGQVMRFRVVPATAPTRARRRTSSGSRRSPHSAPPPTRARCRSTSRTRRRCSCAPKPTATSSSTARAKSRSDRSRPTWERSTPTAPATRSVGTSRPRRTRSWERSRCGRSTTSPPTPTRSTSTRSPSRCSTASRSARRTAAPGEHGRRIARTP